MKKEYIAPAIESTQVEVTHMLAESVVVDGTKTIDTPDVLGKDNKWDIWGDE